jgi:hypothetical protein
MIFGTESGKMTDKYAGRSMDYCKVSDGYIKESE